MFTINDWDHVHELMQEIPHVGMERKYIDRLVKRTKRFQKHAELFIAWAKNLPDVDDNIADELFSGIEDAIHCSKFTLSWLENSTSLDEAKEMAVEQVDNYRRYGSTDFNAEHRYL